MATSSIIAATPGCGAYVVTPQICLAEFCTPLIVALLSYSHYCDDYSQLEGEEGGRVEQVTNDTNDRCDLTPLSTKVPGLVREVRGRFNLRLTRYDRGAYQTSRQSRAGCHTRILC